SKERAWDRSSLCARIVDTTERDGQKIILHGELPNLRLQVLDAGAFLGILLIAGVSEHLGDLIEKLRFPLRDLLRVHIEALSELGERLVTLDGSQGYLGFEVSGVLAARTFH